MKTTTIVLSFLSLFLFNSCDKTNMKSTVASGNIIIANGSNETMLTYYKRHLENYDIEVAMQVVNNNSFKNFGDNSNGFYQLNLSANFNSQKFSEATMKQYKFTIGAYKLNFDDIYGFNRTSTIGNNQDNALVDLFKSSNLSFSIHSINENSLNKTETTTPLVTPVPIFFTYPHVSYTENSTANNNELQIKWNADLKNKNGVVIMLSWHGETVSQTRKYEDKDIKVLKCVEDDGSELINNTMLQYFPEDALVDIAIGRGSIQTTTLDKYSVKLESLTYAYEHFGITRKQ